jgi:molybdopterin/thiamine biosynthesis adenylyltransferase
MASASLDAAAVVANSEVSAAESATLDLDALSRQVATFDVKSQLSLGASSVFISGLGLLGLEVAKNVCLSGPATVTIHDDRPATKANVAFNFFSDQDPPGNHFSSSRAGGYSWEGRTQAEVSLNRLKALNPSVLVQLKSSKTPPPTTTTTTLLDGAADNDAGAEATLASTSPIKPIEAHLPGHDVVILCDAPLAEQVKVNDWCRTAGVKFLSASCRGPFAWAFADFGDGFVTRDKVNGVMFLDVFSFCNVLDALDLRRHLLVLSHSFFLIHSGCFFFVTPSALTPHPPNKKGRRGPERGPGG